MGEPHDFDDGDTHPGGLVDDWLAEEARARAALDEFLTMARALVAAGVATLDLELGLVARGIEVPRARLMAVRLPLAAAVPLKRAS